MSNLKRLVTALAVVGFCLSPSCGGGGDDTVSTGLTAAFTPFTPAPPASSVTLQSGGVSGSTFVVRVVVTSVSNFFGSAFHVTYNPGSATFVSMDASGSFLQGAGIQADSFKATLGSPGDLSVVATRFQNAAGNVPGVSGSGDLLLLTFQATARTSANSFNFASPREVQVCATSTTCQAASVSWSGGLLTAN